MVGVVVGALAAFVQRRKFQQPLSGFLRSAALGVLLLHALHSKAKDLVVDVISLPPLRIQGQPAKAHTQGLELVGGKFCVTARREDARPKRAFLFRTTAERTRWDAWDITPVDADQAVTSLDHPGGMQSDGTRLWIPLAGSKRNGRSLIRAFPVAELVAGRPLTPVFEFPVSDHIGAVAVSIERGLLFGANWDTEKVYVWDLTGSLQRILDGDELQARELGVAAGVERREGVAVQDWKAAGDLLFASGLLRAGGAAPVSSVSRVCWYERFLERDFQRWGVPLPRREGTELAREAMAIAGGFAYFLPEDLGATNRLFRASLAELRERASAAPPRFPRAVTEEKTGGRN